MQWQTNVLHPLLTVIVEDKRHCTVLRGWHGWNWNVDKKVDLNHFPFLEGQ